MRSASSFLLVLASAAALNIVSKGPSPKGRAVSQQYGYAQTFEKRVLEKTFDLYDRDSSGFLDKAEVRAALNAIQGSPVADGTLDHSFSIIDTNHDGKVSKEEFKAMHAQTKVSSFANIFARDNDHEFLANDEPFYTNAQMLRDAKLAKDDTRRFCLDRCLATGFCDGLEDLLQMSTAQVRQFCESCSSTDECELVYDL